MKGAYVQCDCGEWFLPNGRMGCSDECSDKFMKGWSRSIVDAIIDPKGKVELEKEEAQLEERVEWETVEELFQYIVEKYKLPTITDQPQGKEVEYVYNRYGVAVVFTDNTCMLIYEGSPISFGETSYKSYIEFWSTKFPKAHREFMMNFDEEEYALYLRLKDKYHC